MRQGHLSQYFRGIASKRLRLVEVDSSVSHQHEFNGVNGLKQILGDDNGETAVFNARWLYLTDDESEPVNAECTVSWYDSRRDHPTRSEYRLYFQSNAVMEMAEEGDLLIVAMRQDESLLMIVAAAGSTFESQLRWLFDLDDELGKYKIRTEDDADSIELQFAAETILEEIGVEIEETAEDYLEAMLARFGAAFPKTREFSAFARETLPDLSARDDPDGIVIEWMGREELLFRTLERHIVQRRLDEGFADVDSFIAFSLSVHNRRKSRAGHALENHLEIVFQAHGIQYDRGKNTENRAKPDFVFPGIDDYHNPGFPAANLTMLGSKQTCKDRWRQVLSEAARIDEKHLFTLEPSISENQTDEMRAHNLQLVLPQQLHATFTSNQRSWLMDMADFLRMLEHRQLA